MVKVLLFGHLADRAGWREQEMDFTGPLSALTGVLSMADPGLAASLAAPGVRAAVNQTISAEDTALKAGDEVAFLPIYSGG